MHRFFSVLPFSSISYYLCLFNVAWHIKVILFCFFFSSLHSSIEANVMYHAVCYVVYTYIPFHIRLVCRPRRVRVRIKNYFIYYFVPVTCTYAFMCISYSDRWLQHSQIQIDGASLHHTPMCVICNRSQPTQLYEMHSLLPHSACS